jgi:hypothetical protein
MILAPSAIAKNQQVKHDTLTNLFNHPNIKLADLIHTFICP